MHADTWKEGGVLFFSLIKRIYDGVKCNEKKKLLLPCLLHRVSHNEWCIGEDLA